MATACGSCSIRASTKIRTEDTFLITYSLQNFEVGFCISFDFLLLTWREVYSQSFIKRQTSYILSDNEWQRVGGTTSDNEWYNERQRVAIKWQQVATNDNKWQQMTASDNEWQWVTTNDNEWQQVVILANFPFSRITEEPTTMHPKETF